MSVRGALGVYVHTPFCLSKCFYCDFASSVLPSMEAVERHSSAVVRELESQEINGEICSIYFGGGTPSLLPLSHIEKILQSIQKNFNVRRDAEITLEANPICSGDFALDADKITGYKKLGINRISIGAQSFNDKFLAMLGRRHRARDVVTTCERIRKVGDISISLDAMYALPQQQLSDWFEDLRKLVSLEPEHISFYELTIAERTVFGKRTNLELPEEDTVIAMYEGGIEYLAENGFNQYEISNFSRPGKECVHNQLYWSNHEYIGLGAGAWSYINGRRYKNIYPAAAYSEAIELGNESVDYSESLVLLERISESLRLGLRCNKGVNLKDFEKEWGSLAPFIKTMEELLGDKLLARDGERVFLTPRGRLLSDSVFLRFV